MGRYDEKLKGEPAQKLRGKKRSFRDNMASGADDKKMMQDQIRFVADKADKKRRNVTNSLAAYEGILPDAPTDSFAKKKGKGKSINKPQNPTSNKQGKSLDKFLGNNKGGKRRK